MTITLQSLSLEDAQRVIAAGRGKAGEIAGGIPLRRDRQVVGAVGVSGGTGEQDQTVAEAAAAAF